MVGVFKWLLPGEHTIDGSRGECFHSTACIVSMGLMLAWVAQGKVGQHAAPQTGHLFAGTLLIHCIDIWNPCQTEYILGNQKIYIHIFWQKLMWYRWLKSFLMEDKDLFILQVQ